MEAIKTWCSEHRGVWQFIKFSVLSNISTVSRFVCAWLGTALFVDAPGLTSPFKLLVIDYSQASSGGLGGFLSFLVAEVVAQAVNFFVQKEWVFESKPALIRPRPSLP